MRNKLQMLCVSAGLVGLLFGGAVYAEDMSGQAAPSGDSSVSGDSAMSGNDSATSGANAVSGTSQPAVSGDANVDQGSPDTATGDDDY